MKRLQIINLMILLTLGFSNLVAMDASRDEPDVRIFIKKDFIRHTTDEGILSHGTGQDYDDLLSLVVGHIEHLRDVPSHFGLGLIRPKNSKACDLYLDAYKNDHTIQARLQLALQDGIDPAVFHSIPQKFQNHGIDCRLEFIEYVDRS